MGFIDNAKKRCASATTQDQWRRALDNANKRAKALRDEGRAVDEPALESLKIDHRVWLFQKKAEKDEPRGEREREQEGEADADADTDADADADAAAAAEVEVEAAEAAAKESGSDSECELTRPEWVAELELTLAVMQQEVTAARTHQGPVRGWECVSASRAVRNQADKLRHLA